MTRRGLARRVGLQAATAPGIELGAHAQLSEQGRNMCAACPQYGQGMSRDRSVAPAVLRASRMALLLPRSGRVAMQPVTSPAAAPTIAPAAEGPLKNR